ncbi:hypothetical protein M8C21_006052 [Ambrosia artemisiifolia]|uniref:F-box domain-containing protein n=1 Tax=Ambrosia artemisiifolia TaxID=4212 RepID=A0AAD5D6Q5_AMBAR|nr:hypothetical protein M8C21_006052 [Ambrosia artemisiifolia]
MADIISSMPDNVITNILDRLPLQDAVRTDALSRNWRFKWTLLSQLVFDDHFFAHLSETEDKDNHVRVISRILLQLKGAITKFVLSIDDHGYSVINDEDISHWILFLSQKGIKDLTIGKKNVLLFLKLPTHLFSCLGLKHLKLFNCPIHRPTTFHGFPNLLSLDLSLVEFKRWKFEEFVMRCPLLENLKVNVCGSVKLDDIAKLGNLKTLSLVLVNAEKMTNTSSSSSSIFKLLGYLPKLEELELDFVWCNSFPNLQMLEILASDWDDWSTPAIIPPEVDYNTMLQLRSVVFTYCRVTENEVRLLKYLLACSPLLKKIVIRPYSSLENIDISPYKSLGPAEKFMFAQKLLKLHRASSVVDIDLY